MEYVQFEEDNYGPNPILRRKSEPDRLIKLVIKIGLAKDEKRAQYVLIGLVAAMITVSLFLVFGIGQSNNTKISKKVIDNAINRTINSLRN